MNEMNQIPNIVNTYTNRFSKDNGVRTININHIEAPKLYRFYDYIWIIFIILLIILVLYIIIIVNKYNNKIDNETKINNKKNMDKF